MTMRRLLPLALCAVLALGPVPLAAQTAAPATVIADSVRVERDHDLVAEGRVEILFDGYRLTAQKISYDATADRLSIEGPMRITKADGTVLTAEAAELDPALQDGILRSARLVLNRQLQLAAAEILRVDGRYSVLERTVTSSCSVCETDPVPLWQIRARRVTHDEEARQLYFDHARVELLGLPVLYVPRLRLPDPTLKRARGFLMPELRYSGGLGVGLKLPYFIPLGDHADLTVTPYVSTSQTRTVELRYRQAFRSGGIEVNGALSHDDLRKGDTRGYLFAEGAFELPRDFTLRFGIQESSDPAYLLDYGYSSADRLLSDIEVARTRRNEHIETSLSYYTTLRASESNQTIPGVVTEALYHKRLTPGFGGVAELQAQLFAFNRRSGADITGRDLSRASVSAGWRGDWVARNGMVLAAEGELALDYYVLGDDSTNPNPVGRAAPFAALEMRWPMARQGQAGASMVLEPVAQLVWSRDDASGLPNEDSLSVAFDEGNLFSLNRFPGADAYEQGLRANLGIGWTRFDPAGWSLGVTAGRILRADDLGQFSAGSGLSGTASDWLLAVQLAGTSPLSLVNRAIFDDDFDFARNELRMGWNGDKLDLASSYIWQEADPTENRPADSSEWVVDAAYRFHDNWTGKADWRYDFVNERAARAELGVEYRNECITVDLSLSRRFTSSTSVRPDTDFGLTISLEGFGGTSGGTAYRRRCAM